MRGNIRVVEGGVLCFVRSLGEDFKGGLMVFFILEYRGVFIEIYFYFVGSFGRF